jgi:hypothetical protein
MPEVSLPVSSVEKNSPTLKLADSAFCCMSELLELSALGDALSLPDPKRLAVSGLSDALCFSCRRAVDWVCCSGDCLSCLYRDSEGLSALRLLSNRFSPWIWVSL